MDETQLFMDELTHETVSDQTLQLYAISFQLNLNPIEFEINLIKFESHSMYLSSIQFKNLNCMQCHSIFPFK